MCILQSLTETLILILKLCLLEKCASSVFNYINISKLSRTNCISSIRQCLFTSSYCNSQTHLNGLSPPIGEVAVLQLLRPPSSLSFFFLRSGVGTYPLWLLLLGRYWLKGMAVRGSLTDVRRADMSSLRTSGIFLWGAPSDSESLPRPVEGRRRWRSLLTVSWSFLWPSQRDHSAANL